jgi:hypothetical protein
MISAGRVKLGNQVPTDDQLFTDDTPPKIKTSTLHRRRVIQTYLSPKLKLCTRTLLEFNRRPELKPMTKWIAVSEELNDAIELFAASPIRIEHSV